MKKIDITEQDRKTLIDSYLQREIEKKNKPIPPRYENLTWDDPDDLDEWLEKYCYKPWVMPGFKSWIHVQISKDDLMNCAIVNHIFKDKSQRLGYLIADPEFQSWEPYQDPKPIWYEPLSRGEFQEKFAITLRAVCPDEKKWNAKFYIEDGSGRSIYYLRKIVRLNKDSEMTGCIGIDPDPKSNALQEKFNGEFSAKNRVKYATFEALLESVSGK